jgi:putative IMPACT (imprinted ancient) family translation regulator
MSHKRPRSASPPTPSLSDSKGSQGSQETYVSGAIKDRSSTFIALFSHTTPIKQLQAHPDFKTATHRITAWRKPSAQRALTSNVPRLLFDVGHDDDGEQYGGKRLEKVLTEMNVQGAVVVARWYGGVLLGPVRFTHMENCAREAIEKWKMGISATGEEEHRVAQKRKVAEDQKRRPALVRILEERDHSISALRGLLREKTEESSAAKVDENTSRVNDANTTPIKAVNYPAMPLQALERLEKARDATISWILKEIEKVEQQQEQQAQNTIKDCG